jgi:alpha-galactosidase
MDFTLVDLAGAWSRERSVKERQLEMGITAISSLTGTCSSSEHNPFVALKRSGCTEETGEAYGFSLLYSSSFLAQVECSTFEMTRLMMGINPEGFAWVLEPGESFQTPEVAMAYSNEGLGGMSRAFHRLFRERLVRGTWRDRPRPILLNNWEATYFDFNEEKLLQIAEGARACGIELFVLDDGWFGARNDDYRGLGDWYCNLEKIPSGIDGLSKRIEALGLKFGLWMELEMVNRDSDLYRAHPEWMIHTPDRFDPHSRHQYVLDYSNPEVVDYIHDMVCKILSTSKVSYIKWDMNRYMTTPYSNADWTRRGSGVFSHQGEMMHRYILGVYGLYERLTSEFPDVLFESCASGGARFDAGLLFWAPQAWCSDDTDAVERQKIQYGTSYAYPLVSMGAHVSAVPNHQLNRTTSLETRGNVAFFGAFGYELDLNLLSEDELAIVRQQVAFMKEHRELIQITGDLYRLRNPFEGNEMSWMLVSPDKTEAIVLYCQRLNKVSGSWERLRLAGLDRDKVYEVTCDGVQRICLHGSTLMNAGIPISRSTLYDKGGDFASLLFEVKAINLAL